MKIKLQIEGLAELNKQFAKKSEQINRGANEGLKKIGLEILADSKTNLKNNKSQVTGKLFNSGVVVDNKDSTIDVLFKSMYASAVEFGRRAGQMPPVDQILAWVRRKGLTDTFNIRTRKRSARGADFEKRARGLAFIIARSIGRKGTKPAPFLYPAMRNNEAKVERVLKNEIKKYL